MSIFMSFARFIRDSLLTLVVLCLLLTGLTAFIRLEPPASVVTVPFRMILQMTLHIQMIGIPVIVAVYGVVRLVKNGVVRLYWRVCVCWSLSGLWMSFRMYGYRLRRYRRVR